MLYIQDSDYEIAEVNGISRSAVYNRVYSYGWSIKDAITKPTSKRSKEKAEFARIAVKNGISRDVFYCRVRKGWDLRKASTEPVLSRKEVALRVAESQRTILSIGRRKIAEANGIPYSTVISRIRKYGWSVQRAITEPVNVQFRKKAIKNSI